MRLQMKINPGDADYRRGKVQDLRLRLSHSALNHRWPPSGSRARQSKKPCSISNTDIVRELSLPPVKIHGSVLAEDAIRAAIGDWKKKNNVAGEVTAEVAAIS